MVLSFSSRVFGGPVNVRGMPVKGVKMAISMSEVGGLA